MKKICDELYQKYLDQLIDLFYKKKLFKNKRTYNALLNIPKLFYANGVNVEFKPFVGLDNLQIDITKNKRHVKLIFNDKEASYKNGTSSGPLKYGTEETIRKLSEFIIRGKPYGSI